VAQASPIVAQNEWHAESWAKRQVDAASVPAALVTNTGNVVHANAALSPLQSDNRLIAPLRAALLETQLSRSALSVRINTMSRTADENNRRFDVSLVPITSHLTFLLAKDNTLEANLLNALASSRQLFRDLALCSNDFAFETDSRAHFTYTSPGGLLGYTSQELHGARPKIFFGHAGVAPLFSVKSPIHSREVWTAHKSGQDACIVVTSVPMLDSDGEWCGARGVVRDLTALRMQEHEVSKSRAREDLVHAVVTAMRSQVEPRRMMLAAADAIAAATRSHAVSIQSDASGLSASIGTIQGAGHQLCFETSYGSTKNGSLKLMRTEADTAYENSELELLAAVMPHLGIAIALSELLSQQTPTISRVQSC
jgi:PAS domain S-box-containing protein